MTQTKLTNLVNPEVMADMISANLPKKIKFSPLARIDTTLVGQAGESITVPRFNYVGDAEDLTEGVAMGTVALTASTQKATIKQAGKGVEITDKAVLAGYGDPVGEAEAQLELAIASKIDEDFVTALKGATLTHEAGAKISYDVVVDALDKFEEEDDEVKVLFVHPKQVSELRKDPEFVANVAGAYMSGVVGQIAGAEVVKSKRVPYDKSGGTYTNFIVKPNALALYLKREAQVETDRDIKAKTTVLTADAFYAVAIEDESKVVKITTTA